MLLGFKKRFHSAVRDGSKTHTIRALRKIPPRVGETCHCYGDVRQKTMHLLGRFPCVRLQEIRIISRAGAPKLIGDEDESERGYDSCGLYVYIDGVALDAEEKDLLAWRDGFRFQTSDLTTDPNSSGCFDLMAKFWVAEHGKKGYVDFNGQVIHWKWSKEEVRK
jgi:hypothetical protein